jgi:hypothetical protein
MPLVCVHEKCAQLIGRLVTARDVSWMIPGIKMMGGGARILWFQETVAKRIYGEVYRNEPWRRTFYREKWLLLSCCEQLRASVSDA